MRERQRRRKIVLQSRHRLVRRKTEQDSDPDRAAGIRKTEKTGQQRSENEPEKSRRKNRIPDDGETGF